MIRIVASFQIKPENVEKAIELAKELVAETLKEDGCAQYNLAQSPESAQEIVILEGWESKEELDAHSASEHFTRIVPVLAGMCEEAPVIKSYVQIV